MFKKFVFEVVEKGKVDCFCQFNEILNNKANISHALNMNNKQRQISTFNETVRLFQITKHS